MDNATAIDSIFNDTLLPGSSENTTLGMTETVKNCDNEPPEKPEPILDIEQYYYKLSSDLFIALDPIIVGVGLIGAALIIAVMQRPALRTSTMSIYMTALAVSDALVLILDFINNWLKMEVDVYVLGSSDGFCKFHRFFFNVAYTYSAWMVVCLAVEKVLVVWFPFKAKQLCNRRNAIITVSVLPIPILAIYLYNLWAWELKPNGECDMVPEWVTFQSEVGPWLSGTIYSYVPIVLLIFLNSALCYKLWMARARRLDMGGEKSQKALDDHVERRVTITVVTICIAFLLLTTPLALFYIILFLAGEFINPGPEMALAEVLILIFGLSNHAINFFLYILSSPRFRDELRLMFGCARREKNHEGQSRQMHMDGRGRGNMSSMEGTDSKSKNTGSTGMSYSAQKSETSQSGEHKVEIEQPDV